MAGLLLRKKRENLQLGGSLLRVKAIVIQFLILIKRDRENVGRNSLLKFS
jgi:hypothetical protein